MANSYHPPGESNAPLPGYGYRDRNDVRETKGTVMKYGRKEGGKSTKWIKRQNNGVRELFHIKGRRKDVGHKYVRDCKGIRRKDGVQERKKERKKKEKQEESEFNHL